MSDNVELSSVSSEYDIKGSYLALLTSLSLKRLSDYLLVLYTLPLLSGVTDRIRLRLSLLDKLSDVCKLGGIFVTVQTSQNQTHRTSPNRGYVSSVHLRIPQISHQIHRPLGELLAHKLSRRSHPL